MWYVFFCGGINFFILIEYGIMFIDLNLISFLVDEFLVVDMIGMVCLCFRLMLGNLLGFDLFMSRVVCFFNMLIIVLIV